MGMNQLLLGGVLHQQFIFIKMEKQNQKYKNQLKANHRETIQGRSLDTIAENFEFDRSSMVYLDGEEPILSTVY